MAAQSQAVQKHAEALFVHGASVHEHGKRHVLHHVEHGDEVVELVDQPHVATAQHGQLLVGARVHVRAVQQHRAGGGAVDAAHEVQQRRLAGARRADDGHELARGHAERHVVERLERRGAASVHLGEMVDGQNVHEEPFSLTVYGTVCHPALARA